MITITRALKLVYGFSQEQTEEFLEQHQLQNEDPNPFVSIESVIPAGSYYDEYDWYFCVLCSHYDVAHIEKNGLTGMRCAKCGGRMV